MSAAALPDDLDRRRSLFVATLGFAQISARTDMSELKPLRRWLGTRPAQPHAEHHNVAANPARP